LEGITNNFQTWLKSPRFMVSV